jgi:branched-chain amino acid transport system substrate-binding protein
MSYRGTAYGADNCLWFTKYEGSSFHLVQGADPICGTVIQGVKVAASQ